MTHLLKSIALATALAAATPAIAQTGIVTVDMNRVFSESVAARSGATQIQTKYQGTAQTQQNAFNAAATAYNTQVEAARRVVGPNGTTPLPDAARNALQAAEQTLRQADEALNRTQQEANATGEFVRNQILNAMLPLAEAVRAERRATAVVPRNSVLAADPAADVTTLVMTRLDAQLKTVSIVLPQQPAQGAAPAPAAAGAAPARPATTPARPATPQGR